MSRSMGVEQLKQTNAVVGLVLGFDEEGRPLVDFAGNASGQAYPARVVREASGCKPGHEVVLLFEGGDLARPIIIGVLEADDLPAEPETLELRAAKEITLKCGDASITLTRAGKVLIRGKYLLSSSTGVNMVKGGVIHLN